ncbi:MAG TPA: sulfotransferase [Acidimicrobiales bacterium]|nr:sulfotransferase [Acidimicrobiales bacterium]
MTAPGPGPGVVVLGMHRSGTSAVSRVLNLLGADIGPADDLLTEYDNPGGHWESKALVACNDRILAAYGRSWDFPPWLAPGWEHTERATRLLPDLAETFAAVYTGGPWVWKDPRTCLTFPLWRRVLGDGARVVLVLRDPGAVVASVRRRDGIPAFYGVGLWQHYVRASVAASRGLPVVCLRFEDLVAAPAETVATLAGDLRALGVDLGGDPGVAARALEGQLVHGAAPTPTVRRLTASTLRVLQSLPRRSDDFQPPTWREPRWVRPVLLAYRGPWAVRARVGHPLRPGFA